MDKADKVAFIESICKDLKEALLNRVDSMPEEWDGFELRQLLEDVVAQKYNWTKMPMARKRSYNNEVVTRNIL